MSHLVADIQSAESCKLEAYQDTRGVWTIGWGHTGPEVHQGLVWTQAKADAQLMLDIMVSRGYARNLPEWGCLNDCRENAVTELVFNMGLSKWLEFEHCRAALQTKQWQTAHDQLLASEWAGQVQPDGLDKPGRATRLAGYLLTGAYPT